jgi:hypothetical protein
MGTNKFGFVLTLGLIALSFAEQTSETITASVPAPDLVYGNTNPDLLWQSVMSAGFLLLPLVLILWMRRVALRDAVQDPTAAWFSYCKALQWCVNGTMLLWMVSRTSFLRGARDLIAFRLSANSIVSKAP